MTTAVVAGLLVAGCGEDGPGLVTEGEPPVAPYDGPLWVPLGEGDERGAAERALECDADTDYEGGLSDPWPSDSGGETPEEGLEWYFDMVSPGLPDHGYRVEREEAGRVLFSFDVDGETKLAVIVAKDQPDRPGWGPETTAQCDPAEFPASFTDEAGYEVWTDENGGRVPVTELSSNVGAAHCDWQEAHFLSVGGDGPDGTLYARDPEGVLSREMLAAPYNGDATMPSGARDTGYRLDDWRLWLVDGEPSTAYVRTPDGVESWPAVNEGFGCD
jgi:hypothetical protein